jgi:transcriptional regulator with XRE-family HTH domain
MPQDIRTRFAKHLRSLREEKGISVSQLAQKSGVSRQHVRELELRDPQKRVTIVTLEKLAKGLSLEIWKLLQFDN